MGDTHTNPACNRTFGKMDTDADPDQLVTVCDDCFKAVMAPLGHHRNWS